MNIKIQIIDNESRHDDRVSTCKAQRSWPKFGRRECWRGDDELIGSAVKNCCRLDTTHMSSIAKSENGISLEYQDGYYTREI